MRIEIFSGSARPARRSHQVALAINSRLGTRDKIQTGVLDVLDLKLPLLDHKYARHPDPPDNLVLLHERARAADAFIIVAPEYNGSYSGALKNTMDYLFPEYEGKPFGLVTVSAGGLGGISAMRLLQNYCLALKGLVCPTGLITPRVQTLFEDGVIIDDAYGERMDKFLDTFIEFSENVIKP